LLVVDDFAPKGSSHEVQRLHGVAERFIRAAGNNSGRGRLTCEGDLREYRPPRGLILSTGEDIPQGHSVRARLLTLEVTKGDVNLALLTKLQKCGDSGQLAQSIGGYIRWMAQDYTARRAAFDEQVSALRAQCLQKGHARTPVLVANLHAGFQLFLDYALSAGAVDQPACCELADNFRAALSRCVLAQDDVQTAAEPTAVYFSLLKTALSTKQAHFASLSEGPPERHELWGWRRSSISGNWEAPGMCIGWIEADDLYLEPDAAFYIAKQIERSMGESIAITPTTLNKRLAENNLLLDRDQKRKTYKIRKAIGGSTRNILHLSLSKFAGTDD